LGIILARLARAVACSLSVQRGAVAVPFGVYIWICAVWFTATASASDRDLFGHSAGVRGMPGLTRRSKKSRSACKRRVAWTWLRSGRQPGVSSYLFLFQEDWSKILSLLSPFPFFPSHSPSSSSSCPQFLSRSSLPLPPTPPPPLPPRHFPPPSASLGSHPFSPPLNLPISITFFPFFVGLPYPFSLCPISSLFFSYFACFLRSYSPLIGQVELSVLVLAAVTPYASEHAEEFEKK